MGCCLSNLQSQLNNKYNIIIPNLGKQRVREGLEEGLEKGSRGVREGLERG